MLGSRPRRRPKTPREAGSRREARPPGTTQVTRRCRREGRRAAHVGDTFAMKHVSSTGKRVRRSGEGPARGGEGGGRRDDDDDECGWARATGALLVRSLGRPRYITDERDGIVGGCLQVHLRDQGERRANPSKSTTLLPPLGATPVTSPLGLPTAGLVLDHGRNELTFTGPAALGCGMTRPFGVAGERRTLWGAGWSETPESRACSVRLKMEVPVYEGQRGEKRPRGARSG